MIEQMPAGGGRRGRPQRHRALHQLGIHPDLVGERARHRAHDRGIRPRPAAPLPEGAAMTAGVPVQGGEATSQSWTGRLAAGGQDAAARAAAARPPARLRRVVDLRVRRAHARRARGRPRLGRSSHWRARRGGTRRGVGHFVNSAPPLERGAVLLLHGHPPVGEVLHGRVARRPGADLGDRRVAFLVSIGDGVHRLPLQTELRLAVDRHAGQGRAQLRRDRRVLQRPRLRSDAALARHPAAARSSR